MAEHTATVTPGEAISGDAGHMRGHGTYVAEPRLCASVAGAPERVGKLVSVRPAAGRYAAEVGDVVVGRILEVGARRWRVDCNGRQDAALLLSSIHLPGAIQRRRSESDEMQMRLFFAEGELIVAEVQTLYHDGAFGIHTRSLRYGKLVTGVFLAVDASLVRRSRTHFLVFDWGVEVVLGVNGYVWVGRPRRAPDEQDLDAIYSADLDAALTTADRENIARTRNCVAALDHARRTICAEAIAAVFRRSLIHPIRDLLDPSVALSLCAP